MAIDLSAMSPQELVVLLVALGGLLPFIAYHRRVPWWVILPYGFLLVGAVLTNLEHLLWHDVLNFVEHAVGNLGAGLAMVVTAYVGRRHLLAAEAEEPGGT